MAVEKEEVTQVQSSSSNSRVLGRVKWFSNKAGYGFITLLDGSNADVFVHHSAVQVAAEQYKYLVQGEYVECLVTKPTSGPHELHADHVTGVARGMLMCETRREMRLQRPEHPGEDREAAVDDEPNEVKVKVNVKERKPRGESKLAKKEALDQTGEWSLATKKPQAERKRAARSKSAPAP
jgi:cold shock CspA family protein